MTTDTNLKLIKNLSLFRKKYYIYLNERFKNIDLTISEFNYFKELINEDGILQDKIIKNLSIDKAAASRVAQTLEKKNFIKRVRNEKDKRNFNIFLTEDGKKFIPLLKSILNDWNALVVKKCGEKNLEELIKILEIINYKD